MMSRAIKFSKEREQKLLRDIEDRWNETHSDWAPWLANLPRWKDAYRGFLPEKNDPWPGCSNLHIPIQALAVERSHSTLLGVLQQPRGLIELQPTEAADVSRARNAQAFINWAFFQEMEMPPMLDRMAHKSCMFGRSAAVTRWVKDLRRQRHCEAVPLEELGGKRDAAKVAAYYFQDNLISAAKTGNGVAKCKYSDQGRDRDAVITILRDEDRVDPSADELEFEIEHTVLKRDCPVLDVPSPEDLLPSADGPTPETATYHFYSMWMTLGELQEAKSIGKYKIPAELMEILRKAFDTQDTADASALDSPNRLHDEANATVKTVSARRRNKFHVQMVFMPYDADGDDNLEECIFTVLWTSDHKAYLLRAEYLESVFPHGERPFTFFDFIYLDDTPVAIGIPEYIRAISAEINTLHNQIVDANSIRNNPWFAYRAGSSLVPANLRMRPGQGVPIDDPRSIYMPSFNSSSGSDNQTLGMIMDFGERLMPHGEVVTGRGTGGNRTAGGMAMLVSQSQEVWAKYVMRFGNSIARIAEQSMALYSAFMPPAKEFRITGKTDLTKITRKDLIGYDFTCNATMVQANKEIGRAYSLQRFQLLAPHPLFQSAERQYALVEDLLLSQECKDITAILGPEPLATQHPYLTPDQEHSLFVQGITWEPHADENHEDHLEQHRAFSIAPEARWPGTAKILAEHMAHHTRLMGQAQRKAQQQAMGVPPDGSTPGADMGQMGGQNGLMNSVQQQPGAMLDSVQTSAPLAQP
jgi:hypothetical protein